jgi:type I restriction enzyme, S subunit
MSFDGWKEYKIAELYDVFSGLSKPREQFGFGYPFLTFKDVFNNYFLPEKLENLANTNEKEIRSCSIKKGDVFLTRTSETQNELGMSSVALKDYENATFNGFTKRLRFKKDVSIKIDLKYLGYFLRSPFFRNQISQHSSLTTRASLNSTSINSLKIYFPALSIQEKIGNILKCLDDKIEINRQTNQTLEAIAQAIFKEWFVDFNFPGATGEMQNSELGEIPKGWRVGKLGEVYKTTSGGTPSRSKSEYYENGNIPWIKSKELDNSFITETEEKITDAALKNSSAKLLPKHSVLIAMYGATVGEIGITSMEAACNQAICAFMSNDSYPYTFVYQFLKNNKADIISRAVGSAQQNISQDLLKKIEVVLPSIGLVKKYHHVTNSLFEIIENNLFETKTLTQLRDSLLPKLMKGEIEVGAKNLSPLLPLPPQPKTHSLA